jgi:fluoroacetyl-CoA thioesterase
VKDSLAVGLTGTAAHTVTAEMSPPHLPVVVLSTPDMIRLIEHTCLQGMIEHLDDGETTVGTHVCVSHVAAATEGEQVEVSYTLAEREKRRLTFDVKVTCGDRLLSEGTHQRAVVDTSRFG